MRVFKPVVWFVNALANGVLWVLRINTKKGRDQRMSADELRAIVLESSSFMPTKHRSILLNLFDLENITVDDVMVPRRQIESLNFYAPLDDVLHQLETCYHNRLVVYEGDIDKVLGVLHVRKTLTALHNQEFDRETLRALLAEPYYVPSGTPVVQQLQFFQETRQRTALVVNEYGELEGRHARRHHRGADRRIHDVDAAQRAQGRLGRERRMHRLGEHALRELNRWLHLKLPTDGPKTLNGLVLEILEEIPEDDVCLKIGDVMLEVMRSDDQAVRTVKLFKPRGSRTARATTR